MFRHLSTIALLILLAVLATSSTASTYGPQTPIKSLDRLKTEVVGSLDLGNFNVEQTVVFIAKSLLSTT